MSLDAGQRIDTIVSGDAAPFGDVTSASSQIQDNYDPGLWESAAGGYHNRDESTDAPDSRNLKPGVNIGNDLRLQSSDGNG